MSPAEATVGLLLVVSIGLLTRGAIRRQATKPSGEVADTPPASAPLTPLLGVVPPPRTEVPLDDKIIWS